MITALKEAMVGLSLGPKVWADRGWMGPRNLEAMFLRPETLVGLLFQRSFWILAVKWEKG